MELNINQMERYKIIKDFSDGKITRKVAAIKLNCSERNVKYLKNRYLNEGKNGFVHKNTGRIPVNKMDKTTQNKVIALYKEYEGFNFSHFLDENPNIKLSNKTVSRILNDIGIISPKAHKEKKKEIEHPLRPRKKYFGELIQMDASELDWFNTNKKQHLHLAVDDATNTIVGGWFDIQETTKGYIDCLYNILINYGTPKCFYTDNRTTFEIKRAGKSIDANIQFKRICTNLGIEIKTTSVP